METINEANGGNIVRVRDALNSIHRAAGHADARVLGAEIVPGVRPVWGVLTTASRREYAAAASLEAEGFGIYLPQAPRAQVRRGRKIVSLQPMCPGYVFVFVWDIDRHAARLLSCDGVTGILRMAGDRAANSVPYAVIPDDVIDRLRAAENRETSFTVPVEIIVRGKKKNRAYRRKIVHRAIGPSEIIAVRSWSAFADGVAGVSDDAKDETLRKALGLI